PNQPEVFENHRKPGRIPEPLHCRKSGILPASSERSQRSNVEVLEKTDALAPAEHEQLALEQFSTLADRRFGQVPRSGILEVQLHRAFDRGDVDFDKADL